MQREDTSAYEADWRRWKRGVALEALAKERGVTRERMRLRLAKMDVNMTQLALLDRAERAEAETERLKRINREHCNAVNALNLDGARLEARLKTVEAERDAALAAGQEDMRERAAETSKWYSDRLVKAIRALPIKDNP